MIARPECMQCGRVRGVRWRVRLREYVCSLCGNTWKPLEAKRQADAKDTLELAVELERLEVAEERREEAEALAKVAKIQAEESADPDAGDEEEVRRRRRGDPDALGVQSDAEPDALGVGADDSADDFDSPSVPDALGVELDRELEPDTLGVAGAELPSVSPSPSVPGALGAGEHPELELHTPETSDALGVDFTVGLERSQENSGAHSDSSEPHPVPSGRSSPSDRIRRKWGVR